MKEDDFLNLPPIEERNIELNHFPTKMQAFVFRMWDMVPAARLAEVLETSEENVRALAEEMGLRAQNITVDWLCKGYITIIRSAWHILPYEQILTLLGWDTEKLAYILKEEDFLSHKLGDFKPNTEKICYRSLTEDEKKRTEKIRLIMQNMPEDKKAAPPFDFYGKRYMRSGGEKRSPAHSVEITEAWAIEDTVKTEKTDFYIDLFIRDFSEDFGIGLKKGNSDRKIVIRKTLRNRPAEYHEIVVEKTVISINAAAPEGILRALNFLLDLAKEAGGAWFVPRVYKRMPRFETRFIYSYSGLYGNVFDEPIEESYPDALLKAYAKLGINGIWAQAVLYKLQEFPFAPGLSEGWEKRIENLERLVNKAGKYGIKVYLYINEPRALPESFFEKYPDMKGHVSDTFDKLTCMCTSAPRVMNYLYDAIRGLCSRIPDLGGFFTITMSENLTNCYSRAGEKGTNCPRCQKRKPAEVVAEINSVICKAATEVNPEIKTFAWTWAWLGRLKEEGTYDCIEKTDKRVSIMCKSEEVMPFTVAGIPVEVRDYTMMVAGPGEKSKAIWKHARNTGHRTAAKIQINSTWECATLPFLPVFKTIKQHIQNLADEKVQDLMMSWTVGGYPSDNIKIISELFFESDYAVNSMKTLYGENWEAVQRASDIFCEAFSEFPFSLRTLYRGPQNAGPSNLLYEKPTGVLSTMTCYSYDDLAHWFAENFPDDVIDSQLKLLSEKWKMGLDMLAELPPCELLDVAEAGFCIFKSCYNQVRFIRCRDQYLSTKAEKEKQEILSLLQDEKECTLKLYNIMLRNPCIGFEAANHYYFTRAQLQEKVVNCEYLTEVFRLD